MFEDLLKKRRSIRKFQDRKVPKELMDRLLTAALLSPSSRNLRPWTFIAVDDCALIAALSSAKAHGSEFLKTAPSAVVVLADTAMCDVWIEDTSIASAVLLFEAAALGLGACWCQIRLRPHDELQSAEAYVRDLLHIPEGFAVESIIGIGYAAEQIPPYCENDLKTDKLRLNSFKTPYRTVR
jgi:nitroreductase